jgi:hypothetical protein
MPTAISTSIQPGDGDDSFAEVRIQLPDQDTVTLTVHRSLIYPGTINVELDGDMTNDAPSVRFHINDQLVYDSAQLLPAIEDARDEPRSCSCGQSPYGAPGHDGDPAGRGHIPDRAERIAGDFTAVDPERLDDLVHDHASRTGSAVNDDGLPAQISYLMAHGQSEESIRDLLAR